MRNFCHIFHVSPINKLSHYIFRLFFQFSEKRQNIQEIGSASVVLNLECDFNSYCMVNAPPCSLTSEVPVEVMQPAHLQLQLVPHGFLQGLPLGGRLSEVFIGLGHQLDLCFQLPADTLRNEAK